MKRYLRWICCSFFLLTVIAVIWFLQLFTQADDTITYINWDSSVRIEQDGTEHPFVPDPSNNAPISSGVYRFTGTIPKGRPDGYLLFETTGIDLSLSLNGSEIWQSRAEESRSRSYIKAHAQLPLNEGVSGTLSYTCRILDGSAQMLPPLVRFMSYFQSTAQSNAFANMDAIPAGAAALALVLIVGIFLLGIVLKEPDWSLIPLILAAAGLAFFPLIQGQGYSFLPESVYRVLAQIKIEEFIILALALYLVINRQRRFWKYLGVSAAWSGVAFLLCYLISLSTDGSFSLHVNSLFGALIHEGFYEGVVYWLTFWLALTCSLISAYGVARSFTHQKTEAQGLLLQLEMIMENYHVLEGLMAENAARQHEINHQLTALDCLQQNKDYNGMKEMLSRILTEQRSRGHKNFTENRTINTILQDAAGRAQKQNISFRVLVNVPENLNIPEPDLCSLLMNMLDNALEGAKKVTTPEKRYISIHIRVSGVYLAVKCENSFNGELRKDKNGNLLTTKESSAAHGFGCRQMKEISKKYKSIILFKTPDDNIFSVQTAIRIPDR